MMAQHVVVTEYDPAWTEKYRKEAGIIQGILGNNCLAVYHIGSTSVAELAATPVHDLMPVVRGLEEADRAAERFSQAGYEYLGEFGIPGRRYLRKGGDERTHQVHIFQADDMENIGRHLAFRDFMMKHEREREEYARLKKNLAQQFPYDIERYCSGKDAFVRRMEARALAEYDSIWDRLYLAARRVQNPRTISPFIDAGGVAAALVTETGNIYVGVCIDTACTLGMCAERNAIANMITNGESRIQKIVAVMGDGKPGMPCGACREYLMQLDQNSKEIEFLCDLDTRETIKLQELTPHWWGAKAFEKA